MNCLALLHGGVGPAHFFAFKVSQLLVDYNLGWCHSVDVELPQVQQLPQGLYVCEGLGNQHGVEVGSSYAAAAPPGAQSGIAPAVTGAGQPPPGECSHMQFHHNSLV